MIAVFYTSVSDIEGFFRSHEQMDYTWPVTASDTISMGLPSQSSLPSFTSAAAPKSRSSYMPSGSLTPSSEGCALSGNIPVFTPAPLCLVITAVQDASSAAA